MADDGSNPYALVGLASLHSRHGRYGEAEELLQEALANGGARAIEYHARDLVDRGEHDQALRLAVDSFLHGNREALTGLAWTYVGRDKARAFAVMEHAMELGFDGAIAELVILSTTAHDPELTDAYCELAAESGHCNAQRVAGQIQLRTGDERRGAALLWRAFNGGLHWSLFELGELRERQGRLRAARKIYRRLADLGHHHALVKLAALHERANDQSTAEHLAAMYDQLVPPSLGSSGWLAVAEARHQRGDHSGAQDILQRIAAGGETGALVTLAELRRECGDLAGAEAALRRAIDSGATGAKQLLAQWRQRASHKSDTVSGPPSGVLG